MDRAAFRPLVGGGDGRDPRRDDVGAGKIGNKTGHYSTTVGDQPAVLMLVQFEEPPGTPPGPCRFR